MINVCKEMITIKLDSTQMEIVTSSAKNIIVSAGAGSGKTRVLTERVKYLLEQGVTPDSIVCITFTNKAADEMKQRLSDVTGIGDAFIGTIHSFANRIFKNSGTHYELLTKDKEIDIIKGLIKKYGKYVTPDEYMEYIDLKRDIDLGVKEEYVLSDTFKLSTLHELDIFYGNILPSEQDEYPEDIYDICEKCNIITFGQLLRECTDYFKRINGKLEYLLVDELQDIGDSEYKFIMSLNADYNFFVGDDWQSIYAFKGGDVRYFLRLMEDPEWTTYYLTKNYRNAKNILDIAKTVIYQADNIINKEVEAVRSEDGTVIVDTKSNLRNRLELIKMDGHYKDWFILVRANRDIHEISAHLLSMNIPFVSFKQGGSSHDDIQYQMNLDAVKVLTVHSAKGLENKNVILYGNFPVRQKNYLRNSDERKVMYVGCTRAEDTLIILN